LGLVSLLTACNSTSLEDSEATKIINDHFGFPKPVMMILDGHEDNDIWGQAIINFIRTSGYVYNNPAHGMGSVQAALAPTYLPTEKGKGIIKRIDYNGFYKSYTYDGAVVKESLDSIQEILIDKETKIATVKYATKFEPIEPLYSSLCIDRRCKFFGEGLKQKRKNLIKLKKYDKGWRIPQ